MVKDTSYWPDIKYFLMKQISRNEYYLGFTSTSYFQLTFQVPAFFLFFYFHCNLTKDKETAMMRQTN